MTQMSVVRVRIVVLVAFAVVVTACSSSGVPNTGSDADRAQVMSAAVAELLTRQGLPSSTSYLMQSNLDPYAGTATPESNTKGRALTETERSAVETAVRRFAPIRWIDDPADWMTEDLRPTIEGSAILGVGEPVFDADGALVPVRLWCGGTCGIWMTYRLVETDQGWQVTGNEGEIGMA